jgi:hypothetical protein
VAVAVVFAEPRDDGDSVEFVVCVDSGVSEELGLGDGRLASVVTRTAIAVIMPASAVMTPGRLDQKLGFLFSLMSQMAD